MPIDPNYVVKKKELKKFTPVPADKYQVQITDINLVQQMNQFSGKEEDRLNFEFVILDKKDWEFTDEEGVAQIEPLRGRKLWKRIAPSNSPAGKKSKASWFYKLLCAVEKKDLSETELKDISPMTLIGQQLVVMTEIAGEWSNIISFAPAPKELESVPNAAERPVVDETIEPDADLPF